MSALTILAWLRSDGADAEVMVQMGEDANCTI